MAEFSSYDHQLDSALDLLFRLPPQQIRRNLRQLRRLVPHIADDLLTGTDQPLSAAMDPDAARQFLLCEYNRVGNSYRSPWTNTYHPTPRVGVTGNLWFPPPYLRTMEAAANEAFIEYSRLYYDCCLSSVYFWELDPVGFAGVILLKNSGDRLQGVQGCWDSVHVVEVQQQLGLKRATYRLTSSVMLRLKTSNKTSGMMNLGGIVHRQLQQDLKVSSKERCRSHLINIGELVEQVENRLRNSMQEIYFWKTRDVLYRCLWSVLPRHDQRSKPKRSVSMPSVASSSSSSTIRRTPSGKHLLVPALQDLKG